MRRTHKLIILVCAPVLSLGMLGGAAILSARKKQANTRGVSSAAAQRPVSKAELSAGDGKNGHDCLVAVDGIVYQIKDSPYWQNGEHTTSEGQAHCGLDLSQVIDKAPHGRSKLDQLLKIGMLKN